MLSFQEFSDNVNQLKDRIATACQKHNRPVEDVKILPVTKNHPIEAVEFAQQYGFTAVGENKVKDASLRKDRYDGTIQWELIGRLQSNKAKVAVQCFDRIQTVSGEKLLLKLNELSSEFRLTPLPILLQVNTGEDPAKSGFTVEKVLSIMEKAVTCSSLDIQGLMTVAPFSEDKSIANKTFELLRTTQEKINQQFGLSLAELSMGMSTDFEEAIAQGSTLIRVGTSVFGPRESELPPLTP